MYKKIKNFVLGRARDINDPAIHHKMSLIAFFAWIGLGADGLSSSCYGPEESFLALQSHAALGIFVAIATAVTIFIITSSYAKIVEVFPSGGGGYLVASKLLSPTLGMISGCALIIDYVLTIALSIASGSDAIFSLLPAGLYVYKLWFAIFIVLAMIILNLRGAKESVVPLTPIFLFFIVTHVFAIIYTLVTHFSDMHLLISNTHADLTRTSLELGWVGMLMLIMRSYSMGAGTYTGIEAVSNGMPLLREPRVATAKSTMRYMAVSLSFMVVGLMLGYLLYKVTPVHGRTLNAILFENLTAHWNRTGAGIFVLSILFSEAILLFVAAQTGFLGGPRVMANMATDRWLPSQFALLSERLVIKYGILFMGVAALVIMSVGGASVKFLVILYSINVFITFCLSQLGMVRYWWSGKGKRKGWLKNLSINSLGLVLTVFILISVIVLKFFDGGWITLAITGVFVLLSLGIKRYYENTQRHLKRLDSLIKITEVITRSNDKRPLKFDPDGKTAVILVSGFNGMGLHTLMNAVRIFSGQFKNYIFLHAGIVDAESFKGKEEIDRHRHYVEKEMKKYVEFMGRQGYYAESFSAFGTDVAHEIEVLSVNIFAKYPNSVFFGGQIVFPQESILNSILYNHTTFAVQRRLHQHGIPFLVMPIKISN